MRRIGDCMMIATSRSLQAAVRLRPAPCRTCVGCRSRNRNGCRSLQAAARLRPTPRQVRSGFRSLQAAVRLRTGLRRSSPPWKERRNDRCGKTKCGGKINKRKATDSDQRSEPIAKKIRVVSREEDNAKRVERELESAKKREESVQNARCLEISNEHTGTHGLECRHRFRCRLYPHFRFPQHQPVG